MGQGSHGDSIDSRSHTYCILHCHICPGLKVSKIVEKCQSCIYLWRISSGEEQWRVLSALVRRVSVESISGDGKYQRKSQKTSKQAQGQWPCWRSKVYSKWVVYIVRCMVHACMALNVLTRSICAASCTYAVEPAGTGMALHRHIPSHLMYSQLSIIMMTTSACMHADICIFALLDCGRMVYYTLSWGQQDIQLPGERFRDWQPGICHPEGFSEGEWTGLAVQGPSVHSRSIKCTWWVCMIFAEVT